MGKGSRSRLQRNEQNDSAVSTKKLDEKQKHNRTGLISGIACAVFAVVVVVSLVLSAISDSGADVRKTTGMKTDNTEISNAVVSYYFQSKYQSFVSQYSDNLSAFGLNPNLSLKDQASIFGTTWFDYFMDQTKTDLRQLVTMASAAKAEGMTLDETDEATIQTLVDNLKARASAAHMTYSTYLSTAFGKGVTEDVVREAEQLRCFAEKYYTKYTDSLTYSDADYEAYAAEHPDENLAVDYKMYQFVGRSDEDMTEDDYNQELVKVKGYAEQLNEATSPEEYDSILRAILTEQGMAEEEIEEAVKGTSKTATSSSVTEGEWLFSEERKTGARSEVVTASGVSTTYYVVEPVHLNDSKTSNFRMIPVLVGEDGDYDAAEAKAGEILASFQAGEQTGEAFGALADENGVSVKGGLYENYEATADDTDDISKWVSDASRKAGDTEIITYSGYGYVILFYEGDGIPAWKAAAKSSLASEDFSAHIDELAETYHYECIDKALAKIKA